MPIILPYLDLKPNIADTAYIADNAAIAGDVEIGDESSVWFGVTMRGDVNDIKVGKRTNIQENTVVHTTYKVSGAYVGDDVTIGHSAVIHACTIGCRILIGMQACVMDKAIVEDDSIVAAGSLVTPGKVVKSGQLWAGRPARYVRDLTQEEHDYNLWSAKHYAELAANFKKNQK